MADFKDVLNKARQDRDAEEVAAQEAAVQRIQIDRDNLEAAEAWLSRVVIATLEKVKADLDGDFFVTIDDNFSGMKAKDPRRRVVSYTIKPHNARHTAYTYHVAVDVRRDVKCNRSRGSELDPSAVFWGTIDKMTVEDFSAQIEQLIEWWVKNEDH